jgi:hypothetical protein
MTTERVCGAPRLSGFCGRPASFFQVLFIKGQKPGKRYLCDSCARRMREIHGARITIKVIDQEAALPARSVSA